MKIFNVDKQVVGDTSVIRLSICELFTFTLTESTNKGKHLALGVGIMPCEISLQLSIWEK